ncbi:MAG: ATP-grasp domain-containing protein [Candidatus Odinarchaeota archaeon]|nr:ATP-grasp domain-containing protein [Candidatus Odinarchaeota archaeon]
MRCLLILYSINNVLVIGYNARPIACSAKRLGLNVYVVDFWGDVDIFPCVSDSFIVRQHLHDHFKRNFREIMVQEAMEFINRYNIDAVLIGSGFDDYYHLLTPLFDMNAKIYANSLETFKRARNIIFWQTIAKKLGIRVPETIVTNIENYRTNLKDNNLNYPIVAKPTKTGGGHGIRLIRSSEELEKYARRHRAFILQEYIRGIPASTSVLSASFNAIVLSINKQIIGNSALGCKNFVYCGNIVPYFYSDEINKIIEKQSISLSLKLGLIGSNGLDWVISSEGPYLMEINPRFQGTLECVEFITRKNLVKLHISSFHNIIPERVSNNGVAVKFIIFARENCKVQDLTKIPNLYDIPKKGELITAGSPICTVIVYEKKQNVALEKARNIVEQVYNSISTF